MRRVEVIVRGKLPPKKDGANSMWGKASERKRLVALRSAALESFGRDGPLEKEIRLQIEIHDSKERIASIGDLDNFIAGICDGLMAASKRIGGLDSWRDSALIEIAPSRCIGIRDDREVVEITARKVADESGEPWYSVILTGS